MGVRQVVPEGLVEMAPGPELARILAGIEPSRLSGYDCVRVLKAQYRQATHERARVLALIAEVGLCGGVGPAGDELRRGSVPDEFAADEVRAALVLTRRAAQEQVWVAHDLLTRLPEVHAAMLVGVLDEPRARVFADWTLELSPEQARSVCETLVPQAPSLTTGQLIDQIKRLAIAVDPEWARRRYEQALVERKVVGRRNADGSANLSGYNLPLERVAAASGHIDTLAKAVKHVGDTRPIDHIRAELFLGMTDGTYTGLDDTTIIELIRASAHDPTGAEGEGAGTDTAGVEGESSGADTTGAQGQSEGAGADPRGIEGESESADGGDPGGPGRAPQAGMAACPTSDIPALPSAWVGLELRVRLSTLLGHDRYPAELAGWGPIHAELARELTSTLAPAHWRFAITDEHGQLTHCGTTRARPLGAPSRAAHCRAILELQIPATTLHTLATDPHPLGEWAPVITDLARHLTHPRTDPDNDDPARRTPGAVLRRYLETRDRTCVMIGCRAPAHHADQDHTLDHAHGGPTTRSNLGAACRHDHRLKHEGGWRLHQPHPGTFQWTSRLGHTYYRYPPKIIEPLLDPIPSDQPPYPITTPPDHGWENTTIWDQPPPEPKPDPPPRINPNDDMPPF